MHLISIGDRKITGLFHHRRYLKNAYKKIKQETGNGTIIIPYWKSAPYWPLIYTNIAGVCTFEKMVVDRKMMSSKIIKR
jgi:hypothetical protein